MPLRARLPSHMGTLLTHIAGCNFFQCKFRRPNQHLRLQSQITQKCQNMGIFGCVSSSYNRCEVSSIYKFSRDHIL